MTGSSRYHRQTLLPQVGIEGQKRLAQGQVLLVGCGALGCSIAQQLVRAGVGRLRLVDRDLVDLTNLHRQVLFTQEDADEQMPKAIAAAARLAAANPAVSIEPIVVDVDSANIAELAGATRQGTDDFRADIILDGTDNALTRYLINDLSVREGLPWVYGACVGIEGRVMTVVPGATPCLKCLFPEIPAAGELATCDTAGVLGPAAAIVGAAQAALAIRWLVQGDAPAEMVTVDAWSMRFRNISLSDARRGDCECCAGKHFVVLDRPPRTDTAVLCGRDAVQVRGARAMSLDLEALAERLRPIGEVLVHRAFIRFSPMGESVSMSVFPDGRVLVNGTSDMAKARSLVARFVGS